MASFYGNSKTKVLHNSKRKDACRASEILAKNRKPFNNVDAARSLGYRPCRICFKDVLEF